MLRLRKQQLNIYLLMINNRAGRSFASGRMMDKIRPLTIYMSKARTIINNRSLAARVHPRDFDRSII
ncbi:MAG: hypothetical protein PVH19_14725, partial [Planctomycetia bacterium]